MINKHYCKKCFRSVVDPTASDMFLLMSKEPTVCPSCEQEAEVVVWYFKWGEHKVTEDGKHIVAAPRHVGVNPNYTFFGKESLYPEHEQKIVVE